MNANWTGLAGKYPSAKAALENVVKRLGTTENDKKSSAWYSVFATGPGIFGLGNQDKNINAGVNHFGSPFNFPEEFVTVYRLHSMVPDLIEFRELHKDAD